jgi:cytochrome c5
MSWLRPTSLAALVVSVLCAWPRPASPHETVNTTVLFDREIVRILNAHCVMCHAEGGPSFPLETYEQAWLERRKMSASVISRHMPPWPALSGYGSFKNANVVTLRESQFLVS